MLERSLRRYPLWDVLLYRIILRVANLSFLLIICYFQFDFSTCSIYSPNTYKHPIWLTCYSLLSTVKTLIYIMNTIYFHFFCFPTVVVTFQKFYFYGDVITADQGLQRTIMKFFIFRPNRFKRKMHVYRVF